MKILFWSITILLTSAACSPSFKTLGKKTNELVDNIGCKTAKSRMFDVLLAGYDETEKIIRAEELEPLIEKRIRETWKNLSAAQAKNLKENILNFYKEINFTLNNETRPKILKESLAAFEVGVKDGVEYGAYTEKISQKVNSLLAFSQELNLDCEEPEPEQPIEEPIEQPITSPVSHGSHFALAVAYQSCDALERKPMGDNDASVKGIKITGTHSSGSGKKREIASLSEVQSSHYYIKNVQYEKNCVTVANSPLIYDYGGKPYTKSAEPKVLDFFKDGGTGTNVLGIDCSGFVFSSLASGGARISAKTDMKASLVHGIPAKAYMNPSGNGMDCIEPAKFGYSHGTLKDGDIVAISGHIVIIDQVGEDPFGFKKLTKVSECNSLTYKDFDFVIAQSSPTKGGIGISRNTPQSYLKESSTIRNGLEYYAKQNCLAHFNKTNPTISYSSVKIVRHKNTQECRTPALTLRSQECVQSCFVN
ncbi:MAG: hypothetical protein V4596_05675 [Bdellovibrionota bacterium]